MLHDLSDASLPAPDPMRTRFLADYNPFYILSACCMLFGVFAVNGSLDWSPIPLGNVLRIILTPFSPRACPERRSLRP